MYPNDLNDLNVSKGAAMKIEMHKKKKNCLKDAFNNSSKRRLSSNFLLAREPHQKNTVFNLVVSPSLSLSLSCTLLRGPCIIFFDEAINSNALNFQARVVVV